MSRQTKTAPRLVGSQLIGIRFQSNLCRASKQMIALTEKSGQSFLTNWTKNPSWAPIYRNDNGWTTAKAFSNKAIPLTAKAVQRAYGKGKIIGKRFGKESDYLMVDVDAGSQYHPNDAGIEAITETLETLGLCRYMTLRSSDSGGLHLYYPLPKSFSSWAIASTVHATLSAAGITVAAGQCELFPNKKAYGSDYNGHRLPLQAGSFILDEDFQPTTDDRGAFMARWRLAADCQDIETLQERFSNVTTKANTKKEIDLEWTGQGQSNKIMMKLGRLGMKKGFRSPAELSQWIKATVRSLPGFSQYCSRRSKRDIEKGWAMRVAKWAFKANKLFKKQVEKIMSTYNDDVAAEALNRVKAAMEVLGPVPGMGVSKVWHSLRDISKDLFGVGVSWKVFTKHREFILSTLQPEQTPHTSMNGIQLCETQTEKENQTFYTPSNTHREKDRPHPKERQPIDRYSTQMDQNTAPALKYA